MKTISGLKLFTGNSNRVLAQELANYVNIHLGEAEVDRFANQEIRVKINENVRGKDVFVIQSTSIPVNDNLMELLIIIDALKRASANTITAVIPYFGYAKQEKKSSGREPITAKLVADLITTAGASRVVTIDFHAPAIQGFFNIPVDHLIATPLLATYFIKKDLYGKDIVVVSPDAGGVARARNFAERLKSSLAIIFKRRPEVDKTEVMEVVGQVKGKTAIIIDDMISTGSTLVKAIDKLLNMGAKKVYACATHPILAKDALKNLTLSGVEEVVVTNTIPLKKEVIYSKKIKVLSVAGLLGEAITRIYLNKSVSELFK